MLRHALGKRLMRTAGAMVGVILVILFAWMVVAGPITVFCILRMTVHDHLFVHTWPTRFARAMIVRMGGLPSERGSKVVAAT